MSVKMLEKEEVKEAAVQATKPALDLYFRKDAEHAAKLDRRREAYRQKKTVEHMSLSELVGEAIWRMKHVKGWPKHVRGRWFSAHAFDAPVTRACVMGQAVMVLTGAKTYAEAEQGSSALYKFGRLVGKAVSLNDDKYQRLSMPQLKARIEKLEKKQEKAKR